MITKELIEQWQSEWVPFSDLTMSQHIANRAAAHGAAEREAELMAVGMEPDAWLVCSVDDRGRLSLEYAAGWESAAHEHINDSIAEYDIEGASEWVVRPAYNRDKLEAAKLQGLGAGIERGWAQATLDAESKIAAARLQGAEEERKKWEGKIEDRDNAISCQRSTMREMQGQLQKQPSAVNQGLLDVVRSALQPLNNGFVISPASSVHKELIAIAAAQEVGK